MKIIELEVIDFHNFMNQSYMILTDSGVQEEAPSRETSVGNAKLQSASRGLLPGH